MPYILIENNRITGERAFGNENNEGWVYVAELPEPAPSDYHEFSLEKGWYLTPEQQALKDIAELEARVKENTIKKNELLAKAKEQIDILQDEIDLEMSEDIDITEALLKSWKQYRVKLNKLNVEEENITFPAIPS